jgi:arylsulfatase A-like enzyme
MIRPAMDSPSLRFAFAAALSILGARAAEATQAAPAAPAVKPDPPRPHILFILADDLGYADVGWRGGKIETPVLDALAKQGTRLDAYYGLQLCSPSRAALLTGRHPMRYGMSSGVIHPDQHVGMPLEEHTLAEWLRAGGYTTAIFGKWHLGHARREFWPTRRGFDHFEGCLLGETDYFTRQRAGVSDWWHDEKPFVESGYTTSLLGREAAAYVRAHNPSQPLFLYLPFTAPHSPYQAPQEYLDRYPKLPEPRRSYCAMVTALDTAVGEVVAALRERGMLEWTIVIFAGDNGAVGGEVEGGEETRTTTPADNTPFRGGKGTLYEGGIRVPGFACWPGRILSQSTDVPVHMVDWAPTLLALAGATADRKLDGVDLWPLLSAGKPLARSTLLLNIYGPHAAIVMGPWKLARSPTMGGTRLFNVKDDPNEAHDLAVLYPSIVRQLTEELDRLAADAQPSFVLDAPRGEGDALDRPVFPADPPNDGK